jgi:hypothetical protein
MNVPEAWVVPPCRQSRPKSTAAGRTEIAFDYGLKRTGEEFLAKLHAAYQEVSGLTNATFVTAWELRSVFCFDNKCQPSVFDKLFGDSASGSVEYKLQLEVQRQKPQHENTLRANNRNIGSVRVVRRYRRQRLNDHNVMSHMLGNTCMPSVAVKMMVRR